MAKAKFPGKPPKTSQITRLRVSTNGAESANDASRLAAQHAAFGLKIFHQHFATDDEDDEDFVGFEKVGEDFRPHFVPKTTISETSSEHLQPKQQVIASENVLSRTSLELCGSTPSVVCPLPVIDKTVSQTPVPEISVVRNDQHTVTQYLGDRSAVSDVKKNVVKKRKSVHKLDSGKLIAPSKLGNVSDHTKTTKDHHAKVDKSFKLSVEMPIKTTVPSMEDSNLEKLRIKREIERYTTIMTTGAAERQASEERKKHRKHHKLQENGEKAEKLADKIQQLLRKQWESRLQMVEPKPDPPPPPLDKVESLGGRGSSMSASSLSEDDSITSKRPRISIGTTCSSSARKSKIILRKARLQLNQKLLKQLRQPSRLQQLVEAKTPSPVEPVKPAITTPSSILRPAQLVLQNASNVMSKTTSPCPSVQEPIKAASAPNPPPIRTNFQPKIGDVSVTNPLGCAFVMEASDGKGLPGTVVCGVCAAVRRYSFVLQARKFGTFACEPCRKFISRTLRARVSVKCSSGSGNCIHPPVLRWNSACPPEDKPTGEVMTSRCKACWLKLALTGFHMREADHDDLRKLLPGFMQEAIPVAVDRLETLPWAPNRGQMIRMKSNSSTTSNVPPSSSKPAVAPKMKQKASAPAKKAEHSAGSRTRDKSSESSTGDAEVTHTGPRVKHVCRSAVYARAQPRATFDDEKSDTSKSTEGGCDCCSLPEPDTGLPSDGSTAIRSIHTAAKSGRSSSDRKNSYSSPAMPLTTTQGERSRVTFRDDAKFGPTQRVGLMTPAARAWQQQDPTRNKYQGRWSNPGRKPYKYLQKGLVVPDLWEHYDADRVWEQGFAISGSQLSSTASLCYLCGSAGKNELVCCSSCCEPFHPFCVADSSPLSTSTRDCHHWNREAMAVRIASDAEESDAPADADRLPKLGQGPWVCSNCVTCQICRSSCGDRMVCFTCSRAYHWSCLGPAHPSSQRKKRSKWHCFTCSPKEEKFCPLCFRSHSITSAKVECNCCGSWVHAECEQLTINDFYLLEAAAKIEYVCTLCGPERSWRAALNHHATNLYDRIISDLIDLKASPSADLQAINDKVAGGDYQNCADFLSAVRKLTGQSDKAEQVIIACMPWIDNKLKEPSPRQELTITPKLEYDPEGDSRLCALCHGRGEGEPSAEGRLLYCGNDSWLHVNCALWSNEVFEEVDGSLQNVFDALARASGTRCHHCGTKGATVTCCIRGCTVSLHFPCCLLPETEVKLLEGQRMMCSQHAKERAELKIHPANFDVTRCVYVDLGADAKRIKPYHPREVQIIIGSLVVTCIGSIRSDVSANSGNLKPVAFTCQRKFWSTKEPWKLTTYKLKTIYVPATADGKDTETNVTVSHEEDDVIMAESGLNLAELETPDDRELIHMVLEDANFEQELEGGPNAAVATSSPNELRDSGFYSDGRSVDEASPSPDGALEAWLADPEHAILLDSALLATLDMGEVQPKSQTSSNNAQDSRATRHHYPRLQESSTPPKMNLRNNRRISYSQWKKLRLQTRKEKAGQRLERSPSIDWNGNEEWEENTETSGKHPSRAKSERWKIANIPQLDGAADSTDTETDRMISPIKQELNGEEPVKCPRCRRSYRTLQSFNKHAETCVQLLSDSSSDEESEEDIILVQPKQEPMDVVDQADYAPTPTPTPFHPKQEPMDAADSTEQPSTDLIQVPIVNSSSSQQQQLKLGGPASEAKLVAARQQPVKASGITKTRIPRRQLKTNAPQRTLAARSVVQGIAVASPSPLPAYQVTLQSPPPPVLYVTRPDLNSATLSFLPQPPPQQHIIIMPPTIDQSFVQTNVGIPTLTTTPALTLGQAAPAPLVQLVSTLGIMTATNLGMTNYAMPTLQLQSHQPLQVPWEQAMSNQIVILPQQPVLSFNPPPVVTVEPPAPVATVPAQSVTIPAAAPAAETKASLKNPDPSKANDSAADAFAALVQSCCDTSREEAASKNSESKSKESPGKASTDPATPEEKREPVSTSNQPKPTYSYRLAMNTNKKPRLLGADIRSEEKRSDPRQVVVQQLRVVAQPSSPDQPARTFHLKAVAEDLTDPAQDDPVVASASSSSFTAETAVTVSEISDVFATPPASSEPPVLPSDIEAEPPVAWPRVESPAPAEEPPKAIREQVKVKKEAHIVYELASDDGFFAQSESLSAVWKKLIDTVQDARLAFKMEPLYNGCLKSIDERCLHLTGLQHHALINLLEQLPGADQCPDYAFRYRSRRDRQSAADKFDAGSAHGCIRAAPYAGRSPYDMFGWLASEYRPRPQPIARASTASSDAEAAQSTGRRATNFELLPMSVRFKHLRQTAKHSVGVYRSHIHGRGLFCKRDIECGEMVVEYAGQVIRSVLCDKREKEYEAKGMGCYMFRVDDQTVVDATVHGNAARFINHSCEPNCYSKIVDIFGKKHIIIFALRRIQRGEELTYDYKFPLEDVKIPCSCGSRKCRKYLN